MRSLRLFVFLTPLMIASATIGACSDDETGSTPGVDSGSDTATLPDTSLPDTSIPVVDSNMPDTKEAAATKGNIQFTITYSGTQTGPLRLVCFAGVPPSAPIPVDGTSINTPVFPVMHTLMGFPPGDYTCGAYVDVGNNNLMGPGAEDPVKGVAVLGVMAGQTSMINVPIADPVVDGGADADGG